jgi:2TM domain
MSEQTQTRVEGSDLRGLAIAQLGKKRDLQAHALAYTAVQTFLIAIWFAMGAGFFWPMFPIFGWGIGLAFHAWDVFSPANPSEQQIEREMARLAHRAGKP